MNYIQQRIKKVFVHIFLAAFQSNVDYDKAFFEVFDMSWTNSHLSILNEEDHFTITLLSCLSIITYLTNGEKRGQAMTSATLQLFLEGNPDSTLKNFFRRPFLQKPSTIAGNTMEENTPTSVAATITSSCSMNTYPGTTISSSSRGRGTGPTRINRGTWFRGYKRGNFYLFQPFHRGHPYHQNHRP